MRQMKIVHAFSYLVEVSLLTSFLLVLQLAWADTPLQQASQKLKIPDVIGITSSTNTIKVELNGNIIKPGDPIPAKNFKNLEFQKVSWSDDDEDSKYTLLMLDIDWKSRQNGTSSFHNLFTSVNIPGSNINRGQTLVVFDPPHVPCQPSTKHRLVLLAFRQTQNIDIINIVHISAAAGPSQTRENFNLDEFVSRNRLSLGAANVFMAIGDANGICSGSSTIHSLQHVSISLVIMVMLTVVFGFSSGRSTRTTTITL